MYTIFIVNLYSKAEHEIKWTLTIVVFHVQLLCLIGEVTLQVWAPNLRRIVIAQVHTEYPRASPTGWVCLIPTV
jgi:hypothetical protein